MVLLGLLLLLGSWRAQTMTKKKNLKKAKNNPETQQTADELFDEHFSDLATKPPVTPEKPENTISIPVTEDIEDYIEEEEDRIEQMTEFITKRREIIKTKQLKQRRNLPKVFQQIQHDKRIPSALNMFSGKTKQEVFAVLATVFNDHIDFIALDDTKELLYYEPTEGIWRFDAEIYIEQTIRDFIPRISRFGLNETLDMIRTKKNVYQPRSLLDSGNYLATRNNVLEFNDDGSYQIIPFSPELYLTKKIHATHGLANDSPPIKQFLNEVTDADGQRVLLEMLGMSLYSGYPIHNIFCFLGSQDAGKDTTIKLIQKLLGSDCYSNVSINDITRDRRMARSLIGKKANICAELEEIVIKNPAILKQLVGESTIEADLKHANKTFKFQNEATIIFAANKLPPIYDSSGATKGKFIVVKFPHSFHNNPDPKKLEKISTEKDLSGLLNQALLGLKNLLKRGRFRLEETTLEERVETYDRDADPVAHFLNNYPYIIFGNFEIKVDWFYQFFLDHCKKEGLITVNDKTFGRRLKKMMDDQGTPYIKRRRGTGANRYYVYEGFTIDIDKMRIDEAKSKLIS